MSKRQGGVEGQSQEISEKRAFWPEGTDGPKAPGERCLNYRGQVFEV